MPTEAEKLLDNVSCFITPSAIWRNFIELITPHAVNRRRTVKKTDTENLLHTQKY
jgi:hypothetical protein